MRLRLWLAVLLATIPATARANDHTASFFLGPSFASGSRLFGLQATLEVSFPALAVHDYVGIVADISVHGGSVTRGDLTRATFLGGARLLTPNALGGRHVPSGHVLIGLVRSHGVTGPDNNVAAAFGGGYEFLFRNSQPGTVGTESGGWSVRAQADYVVQQSLDGFARASAGLAYRFKERP
jgi:hypothetical protein